MLQSWKIRDIPFLEGRVLQNSSQNLGEFPPHSFSYLSRFEVPLMLRVWDITYLSGGPIRLTNYIFHICITIVKEFQLIYKNVTGVY